MSTPELHLQTSFVLNVAGRITGTREPGASPGPLFVLARGWERCAWAIRADVPDGLAREIDRLARDEPVAMDLRTAPVYADRYLALLDVQGRSSRDPGPPIQPTAGPAFVFPAEVEQPAGVAGVEDERLLQRHFRGWSVGEIAAGRAPVRAVFEAGYPVSVCFCARSSDAAAEAGLETAPAWRGRGYGPRAAAAWAIAIRASGRTPLYSTSWGNAASLAVARKLGLIAYASVWMLVAR